MRKKQPYRQPNIPPFHSANIKTPEVWKVRWKALGQDWRTEPEISTQRQAELAKYRAITSDAEKDIYPFSGVKLNRADIEWLLASHENGHGPVIWSDENQRSRLGLDLRGADLSSNETQSTDLTGLPLSRLIGGRNNFADEYPNIHARIHLEGANLSSAHLEGANLSSAHLEGANLSSAHLEGALFYSASLKDAYLERTHLDGAHLVDAYLEGAYLVNAHLEGADLTGAYLEGVDLTGAYLEETNMTDVSLIDENYIGPFLADIRWGNTNMALVEWSQIAILRDEYQARQAKDDEYKKKEIFTRIDEFKRAVRANRQLSVVLQAQGLNEDAARFAYRAQSLQKKVLWFRLIEGHLSLRTRLPILGSWLFSWFMFLIAGYGHQLDERS